MSEQNFKKIKARLSANVIALRKQQNIAQERLGLEAGVDRTVISKIERQLANPSLEILTRIASFLEVDVNDLLKK